MYSDELCREPFDRGRELGDGGAITGRGCLQVRDGVHCLLLQVPVVRVCGGVVRGDVGSAGIVSQQEAPLPVCGREKNFEVRERLFVRSPLIPLSTIRRENAHVKHELLCIILDLLA